MTQIKQNLKEKNNRLNAKIYNFCSSRNISKQMNTQTIDRDKNITHIFEERTGIQNIQRISCFDNKKITTFI